MRPITYYILALAGVVVILAFFVSQSSERVRVGYKLTRLREERSALIEDGRKLKYNITRLAEHNGLAESARRLGLNLQSPVSSRPPD